MRCVDVGRRCVAVRTRAAAPLLALHRCRDRCGSCFPRRRRRKASMKASFDEMNDASTVRTHYGAYGRWLDGQDAAVMHARRAEAEMVFRRVGITFAVYGTKDEDGAGTERLIPFDVIPRIIPRHEWQQLEAGLRQRVNALNRFIADVYHAQEILRAGIVPQEQVLK